MMKVDQNNLWLLLIANFPLVAALFIALYRGWIVMGPTHDHQLAEKDKEIEFREKLRSEALTEKTLVEERTKETIAAMKDLSLVVDQSLNLNTQLVSEIIVTRSAGRGKKRA